MAKKPFMPRNNNDKMLWLGNFASKLGAYAVKYHISAAEQADIHAAAAYFNYWMRYHQVFKDYLQSITAFKMEFCDGALSGTPSLEPEPPVMPPKPPVVEPGAFKRAVSLGKRIKAHYSYTLSDGRDLGLEGAEHIIDHGAIKPVLQSALSAGHPIIKWRKQKMTGIEFHVRRGKDKPFEYLTTSIVPDFADPHPLPPSGESEQWAYRAIYLLNNEWTGQWSDDLVVWVVGV